MFTKKFYIKHAHMHTCTLNDVFRIINRCFLMKRYIVLVIMIVPHTLLCDGCGVGGA